jgi:oligopeptidase B
MSKKTIPPQALKKPKKLQLFGQELVDNYYWLRDKESKEVLEYLRKENDYTKSRTKHLEPFIEKLFKEMKNRIKEDDESVPFKFKDYYYFHRKEKGKEYKKHYRKSAKKNAAEELILDINQLAEEHDYYKVQTMKISPNQKLLAYSVDTTGYEKFAIMIKNLETNETTATNIENIGANFEWLDDKTIFYVLRDDAQRPATVKKHILGSSTDDDEIIFNEQDTKRNVYLWKSRDRKYLFINSRSKTSAEIQFMNTSGNANGFHMFHPREEKHEYSIYHRNGDFYIVTNTDDATNFKLMKTKVDNTDRKVWEELIPHNEEVRIHWAETFDDFVALFKRHDGLMKVEIFYGKDNPKNHDIAFPEPIYGVSDGDNYEFSANKIRLVYSSLVTPESIFDYHIENKKLELLKEEEIKHYNKEEYVTKRIFVTARDGTKVPISIVHKKGLQTPAPTMLYGYGSYGYPIDTRFTPTMVSLIERGMVYIIAHIRGGGEMGRQWYDNGKMLKKKNTFNDFIDCAKYLLENKITTADQLVIYGGSAGGLLMGAVMNMNPELFHLVIARVPFVDVINTMLDESIPLTTQEFEEWGNPKKEEYFKYILSYSPYDNIKAMEYPNILVTAGLNDPRVAYWESAKFVAKLRELKKDNNELLLKMNMSAGHGGASGRYARMKELAFIYGYALDKVGLAK